MTVASKPHSSSGSSSLRLGVAVNLRSLDALRGILAVYVVLHHARWLLWSGFDLWGAVPHPAWQKLLVYSLVPPLRFGHEAVMVFFVLSGFFIHLRAAQQMAAGQTATLRTANFFKRRAHRLVPPYLLALGLTVLLDAVGRSFDPAFYTGETGNSFVDENFRHTGYSVSSVVPALCLLPSSFGQHFGSNGPLWSLGFEVVYYLFYPAWLFLRQRGWLMGYGVGGLLAALGLGLASRGFLPSVLAHYPVWLAGAALAESVQTPHRRRRTWLFPTGLLVALGLDLLHPPLPAALLAYVLGGSATVLTFAFLPLRVSDFWLHRFWEKVGLGSYSIYIIHFPMLTLLGSLTLVRLGHFPSGGWLAAGGASLTLLFCWGCFLGCERFFLHRKLLPPGDLPPAAPLTNPLHPTPQS